MKEEGGVAGCHAPLCHPHPTRWQVWLNPMFGETGFVGDPDTDCARVPLQLPPRIAIIDDSSPPVPAGCVTVAAGGAGVLADYVSALPPGEL